MLLIALLKLLDKKSKRKIEGSVHLLYLPLTFGLRKYIGCFVSLYAYIESRPPAKQGGDF